MIYQVTPVSVRPVEDDKMLSSVGLKSSSEWEVFSVKDSPGEYLKHRQDSTLFLARMV